MTISELIAALDRIRAEHGDLPVLHHDDWENFVVTLVRVEEEDDGIPAHVVLEDDQHRLTHPE